MTNSPAEVRIFLADDEQKEFNDCESVIGHGLDTFIEVGTALATIREKRLYRANYPSFQAYCAQKWSISKRHADRLITAVEIAATVTPIGATPFTKVVNKTGPIGPIPSTTPYTKPTSESQIRPLATIPAEQRPAAWQDAVQSAPNGIPTAKQVQAAVDKVIEDRKPKPSQPEPAELRTEAKPDPIPAASVATGQTRVNGVVQADPPDIAALRQKTGMSPAYIPEVTEPTQREPGCDDDDEPVADYAEADATISDTAWLESLPLYSQLDERLRKAFAIDALLYRTMEAPRRTFAHIASRAMKQSATQAPYRFRLKSFLSIQDPSRWIRCQATENGGCGGTGQIPFFGECQVCRGQGYRIN